MRLEFPDRWAALDSPLHRFDPRAKLLSFLLAILIVVSEPRTELWAYAGYFGLLLVAWALSRVPPAFALSRVLLAAPFILAPALFLPISANWGGAPEPVALGVSLALRSYAAFLLVTLLISTSRLNELLAAMRSLGLPGSFCLLCSMSYRYLSLLAGEQLRVRRAMEARLPGRLRSARLTLYGNLAALTFMRSWERAHTVHAAMLSRGFDGEFHPLRRPRLRIHDIGGAVAFTGAFLALRVLA